MRKKNLVLEGNKRVRRRRGRRRAGRRLAGGALALATLAASVCTLLYFVTGDISLGIDKVQAQVLEGVSAGDLEGSGNTGDLQTVPPVMDGMWPDTVSSGDMGRTGYLEEMAGYSMKEPGDILIFLDPGHGGEDEGCARKGVQEKELNLQIARAAGEKLQELGYQVLFTRESDETLTLDERVQAANDARADLYISIHQNASEEAGPKGLEVWYCGEGRGQESERLARLLSKFVVQRAGMESREICESDTLRVLRESNMPACLVETGFLSNASERTNLADAAYQEKIAAGIADAVDLYFYPKTMYLTFDDGPSEENTARVLDILKERGIQATFFVVGESVERHPETARRIVEEGHTLGIHCYNHDYQTVYDSVDSYLEDFQKAYQAVYEATGVEAELFRFPGGSVNAYNGDVCQEIIERMTEDGYIYYDWNASLEDAVKKPDPQTLLENGVSSTLGRERVVMLAHDVVYATTQCLEELLNSLPEYRMEALTAQVEPIQF